MGVDGNISDINGIRAILQKYIKDIKYDSDKKDFIVNYKCFCDEKTPKFFYHIIVY